MQLQVFDDKDRAGAAAAADGAARIREALATHGEANIVVATGASQFEMLQHLVSEPDIRWDRVTAFHLDEYVGLAITHPASFALYLWQRFHSQLPLPLRAFHYLDGERDPRSEVARVGGQIRGRRIDAAFIGIGENGHLAFNDPPADFDTDEPYLVVDLDEDCRRQQLGEGWFPDFEAVPQRAISMSVRQILRADHLIATVPDDRKAEAVRNVVEGEVTNRVPASILQQHDSCGLYLDEPAASRLDHRGAVA